jgi:uncharacterized membrane protein
MASGRADPDATGMDKPRVEGTDGAAPALVDQSGAHPAARAEGTADAEAPLPAASSAERELPARAGPTRADTADPDAATRARAELDVLEATGGIVARTVALSGLFGLSLVLWAQLSFQARWVTRFVTENELDIDLRTRLIYSMVGGALVGALGGAVALFMARRRGRALASVERVLWFASPLLLLPFLPIFFRAKAWKDRHEQLLPAALLVCLIAEILLQRSFAAVPGRLVRAWHWLRAKLPALWQRHGPLIVVITGVVFYALFMSFFDLRWHHKLRTHNFDLSINNHLVYGGLEGSFFQTTVSHASDPEAYLAAHAKIGAYLFLPLYALYPHPEFLLVLQAMVLAVGALPLFAFAKKRIPEWAAASVAVAYLCYHPMHSVTFVESFWVPIASTFVIACVWALDAQRFVLAGLFFVAGVLMREDMPVGFAIIGAFLLLTGHRPVAGLIIMIVSTIWFVVLRFYIMDAAGNWWFPDMYKALWAPGERGFKSVIKTLVTNPMFVLGKILTEEKIHYLLHIFVPVAFLPARRWYLWAAFLPGAILTLLATNYKPIYTYSFQYVMHWTPYVFLATPLALAAILRGSDRGVARMRAAVGAMLFATAVLTYNYGAFAARTGSIKAGYHALDFEFTQAERERYASLREILELIPKEASVAATENVGPFVSSRKVMYAMRQGPHGAEFILASSRELGLENTKKKLKEALENKSYGLVARKADFALFKKGHDPSHNERILREWKFD